MWWKTKRPPTVWRPLPPVSTSLNSLISSAATYRSSVSPVGVDGISPHQSGALPFTVISGSFTIKSGVPMVHDLPSGYCLRCRHVGRIAARRTRVGPLADHRDFFVAQRRIVLVFLNADVLFHVPRRHHAGVRPNSRALLDGTGPRPHFFVRRERHRSDTVGTMAILTAALKNGGDVFGIGWPRGCLRADADTGEHHECGCDARGQNVRAKRRQSNWLELTNHHVLREVDRIVRAANSSR